MPLHWCLHNHPANWLRGREGGARSPSPNVFFEANDLNQQRIKAVVWNILNAFFFGGDEGKDRQNKQKTQTSLTLLSCRERKTEEVCFR